ncbi:MAG: S-layer homology domain-containing protein [Lachnospiraceae bacterium]|nr:S-layer homology domain-containing protein [Lachnospiraceae bacterium]
MRKRLITLMLVLALVMGTVYTGAPVGVSAANEETQEQMTDVLLKIKTKLELPDEFTEFRYNYNNYGEKATWYLNWTTADSAKTVTVNCDDEAHIMNMSSYENTQMSGVPDKTAEEMAPAAEALLVRLFPEAKGRVVLKSTNYQYYRAAYRFLYRRIENNIEMPDNYIAIMIGYKDGNLISADANWNYTAAIPSADKLIGADAAKSKIGKKLEMVPRYYVGYDEDGNEKVFLAYSPSMSYIAADANSGKIYTKKNYWGEDPEYGSKEAYDEDAVNSADNGRGYEAKLSDAEIKRIAELQNLISSDDAVKLIKANKYLLVDENINSVTANLNEYKDRYTWVITMRDNRPEDYEKGDYYRAYARATVDASTGKLLSYSASTKGMYYYSDQEIEGIKFNYSKKQCRNIFEEFVKSFESERFAKVQLSADNADMQYTDDMGRNYIFSYGYNYTRYNDGIPFASNGINGSVDRITGKVYYYNMNWTDAEVPSAKGIIGEAKAFDAYMGYEGFDLVYEIVNKYENTGSIYGYGNEQTVRLVYRTAISPAFVDAFTGKQLNYNGEEYEVVRTDYQYNDIAGTKYEKAIRILAGMGVGLPGESFEPSKKITAEELGQLIMKMPVIGYREDLFVGDKALSRQEAAKLIVTAMGLSTVAKLDIYKLSYKDAKDVAKGYEGYVAIAGAMGLIGSKTDKKFKPKTGLTRGEAAQMLLNAANVISSAE